MNHLVKSAYYTKSFWVNNPMHRRVKSQNLRKYQANKKIMHASLRGSPIPFPNEESKLPPIAPQLEIQTSVQRHNKTVIYIYIL
jgi:hypothetical protein